MSLKLGSFIAVLAVAGLAWAGETSNLPEGGGGGGVAALGISDANRSAMASSNCGGASNCFATAKEAIHYVNDNFCDSGRRKVYLEARRYPEYVNLCEKSDLSQCTPTTGEIVISGGYGLGSFKSADLDDSRRGLTSGTTFVAEAPNDGDSTYIKIEGACAATLENIGVEVAGDSEGGETEIGIHLESNSSATLTIRNGVIQGDLSNNSVGMLVDYTSLGSGWVFLDEVDFTVRFDDTSGSDAIALWWRDLRSSNIVARAVRFDSVCLGCTTAEGDLIRYGDVLGDNGSVDYLGLFFAAGGPAINLEVYDEDSSGWNVNHYGTVVSRLMDGQAISVVGSGGNTHNITYHGGVQGIENLSVASAFGAQNPSYRIGLVPALAGTAGNTVCPLRGSLQCNACYDSVAGTDSGCASTTGVRYCDCE